MIQAWELRLAAVLVAFVAYVGAYAIGHHRGVESERARNDAKEANAKAERAAEVAKVVQAQQAVTNAAEARYEALRGKNDEQAQQLIQYAALANQRCEYSSLAGRVRVNSPVRVAVPSTPQGTSKPDASASRTPDHDDSGTITSTDIAREVTTCEAVRDQLVTLQSWIKDQGLAQ